MKIVLVTGMGKSKDGQYYNLFASGWSTKGRYHYTTYYPYMLAYTSSLLKDRTNHQVLLLDGNFLGYNIGKYAEVLTDLKPDLVIMESDCLTYSEDIEMLTRVKESSQCRVLMCGAYPTAESERVLNAGVDFVAIGEFELVVTEFIQNGFKPDTQGIYPNARRELLHPDELPLPENKDIKRRDYSRIYACEYREVEIISSRGCPFDCNFCVSRNVYDGKANYRPRDPKKIVEEIEYLRREIPDLEGIFFNDRTHTVRKSFNMALCEEIIKSGNNDFHYECLGNFTGLDEELLVLMKEAGYYKVRVGLETIPDEDADRAFSNKNAKKNLTKMVEVLECCRKIGMKVYLSLSVGTVGSSLASDLKTLDWVKNLHEEGLFQEYQYSINTPMPGTPFFEIAKNEGILLSDNIAEFNGMGGCVIEYPHYPRLDILKSFQAFEEFGTGIYKKNMENGINYSMYDKQWVKKVMDITKISERY